MDIIKIGATVWTTRLNEVIEGTVDSEMTMPENSKRYNLVSAKGERASVVDPAFIYTNKAQASKAVLRAMGETP